MKLFLDSAILDEIKLAAATGLLDGVTTNPTLIAKSGRKHEEVVAEIAAIVNGPISAEVLSTTTAEMLTEGKQLAKLHPNITVKLPMIVEAMPVVTQLAAAGIKTNVTLVFSVNQALLAAKAGATFISPFVGRLDDTGENGMQVVADIVQVFKHYKFSTQVLVASVRTPEHVRQAALLGADIATLPYLVFMELFNHPLTTAGVEKFLQDAGITPTKV
ncbi:MAG: fructose-6-phosphate aldolase [Candidatus Kerfeldbacteria bacterium]|nr:fructose-6-phosphate aldolase [Candidatus Kerfeldbacteria bacterium]